MSKSSLQLVGGAHVIPWDLQHREIIGIRGCDHNLQVPGTICMCFCPDVSVYLVLSCGSALVPAAMTRLIVPRAQPKSNQSLSM
jgi:hypothetical protein